jgi:hypothetical protein
VVDKNSAVDESSGVVNLVIPKEVVIPTVLEIFYQDLHRKALVLVNSTKVEIFYQDL